jgi:hypothetical protein
MKREGREEPQQGGNMTNDLKTPTDDRISKLKSWVEYHLEAAKWEDSEEWRQYHLDAAEWRQEKLNNMLKGH